ncbi:MAG: discoidin domain-containing protein, partial [Bacteroidota bacterium]
STIARPGSGGVSFQRRTSTNNNSSSNSKGSPALAEWVRIVRSGNSFKSYHSNNGTSWTQIGGTVNISMSSTVYVGLCVTSHKDGTLTTASINNVSVNAGSTVPTGNLALNKSATQHSTTNGGAASRAVDGNTNGNWGANSVTHTKKTAAAWWRVDLGSTKSIGDIKVWNRVNCCTHRLGNFTIKVQNSNFQTVWSQTITSSPSPSVTVNAGGASGRYIRIDQNINEPLSLAEVQVYGSNSRLADIEKPLQVYPNPATSAILIDGLEEGEVVQIYSMLGNLVATSQTRKVNVATLTKGIYIIRVEGRKPVKFVKE